MEVVNRLPRPTDSAALSRLVSAQQILCGRCVSEEDCERAVELLEELARPVEDEGFGYFPALLTLASLHETGFEPAIAEDGKKAARYYLRLLTHQDVATGLDADLMCEAATQLCGLVKDGKAALEEAEIDGLEKLAAGELSGSVGAVSTWARFAVVEASRLLQESREDPKLREQREARKKAQEERREHELARQRDVAQAVLARAEEIRQQGNDDYRQGQLPGNARRRDDFALAVRCYQKAADCLTECLSGLSVAVQEAAEVRRQRGILYSNAAQVQLVLENWHEVAELAQKALEDDPQSVKSKYRLARAHVGLKEWEAAARTTDGALNDIASDRQADDIKLELWKLAEEISKALPSWKWASSKPAVKEKKAEADWEKRLVGKWDYGNGYYEIILEKWGALYWKEKEMRVDLMRKGMLRWTGEYEMLSGLILNLSYEPGSDVVITEFIPPPDIPEEQRWKGPTKFTATRIAELDKAQEPEVVTDLDPPPPPEAFPQPPPEDPVEEEVQPTLPADTPQELWLRGHPELAGCYGLMPDVAPPGGAVGSHAVYRRPGGRGGERAAAQLYLWYRGGNWGVSEALNASSLGAPFLARCPDGTGRTQHPLELRRPRWYVRRPARRGLGQEELDPGITLRAEQPSGVAAARSGGASAAVEASAAATGSEELPLATAELPPSVASATAAADEGEVRAASLSGMD